MAESSPFTWLQYSLHSARLRAPRKGLPEVIYLQDLRESLGVKLLRELLQVFVVREGLPDEGEDPLERGLVLQLEIYRDLKQMVQEVLLAVLVAQASLYTIVSMGYLPPGRPS